MRASNIAFLAMFMFLASGAETATQPPDILISRMFVKIEQRQSFVDKTIKELNTKEGQAIIDAIIKIISNSGRKPEPQDGGEGTGTMAAASATVGTIDAKKLRVTGRVEGEAYYRNIMAPRGYTVCYARSSSPRSNYRGIETSGDTSWSSTISRPKKGGGGLSMYMVVPVRSYTTRVMGSFDIAFVRTGLWKNGSVKCQPNGFHPWISRNNSTRLNVKKGKE